MSPIIRLAPALAAAIFLAAMLLAGGAQAQVFPTPDRGGNERDPVTGYLCLTPACDVLRLPQSNCICQKENPSENNLQRLRLTCSTTVNGTWQACPVQPRYGS